MIERASEPQNLSFTDLHPSVGDSRAEILEGLAAEKKSVNPKWFYDERGSELFDAITRLPEYYPTRTEKQILSANAAAIGERCANDCILLEPGSGSCEKVRLLLDAVRPAAYAPVDISADFLRAAATELAAEYPWLSVEAVCADFNRDWSFVDSLPAGRRIVFYPGSTIGNLEPHSARQFLEQIRDVVGSGGGAIIGVDLHKSRDILHAAYNDAAGVTAAFNLNVLSRLNTLMDAAFDPALFRHEAFYNEQARRIEMHLVSAEQQTVRVNGTYVEFDQDETLHTENSYKYTIDDFADLAASAGLALEQTWTDADNLFSVHYLTNP